jgi:hypothetical protein
MKDWGPLGELIALAYAVAGALAVLWLVGVFWLALRTVACALAAVRIAVGSGGQHLSRAPPEEWLTQRQSVKGTKKQRGRVHHTRPALCSRSALAVSVSSFGAVLTWRSLHAYPGAGGANPHLGLNQVSGWRKWR